YGNVGAAMAYLLSVFVQTFFYLVKIEAFYGSFGVLAACAACAFLSGYLTPLFTTNTFFVPIVGMVVYGVLLACTIQIRQKDWQLLRQVITA
ncbi:MAG TPA: hypothetical protein VFL47_06225, partial [Flavisolibacter sp.]|nr:hypothetical protein [Flavisolibacter sp.]